MIKPRKKPKKIEWSKNRPQRPDSDPMLPELRKLLADDKRSFHTKADTTGISPSTIKKIQDGTTRRPAGTTLQMLGAAYGYKLKFVK